MFIMMDHNHRTYEKFLRILRVTKLYWLGCCCCKHMVIQQVDEMNETNMRHLSVDNDNVIAATGRLKRSITEETVYDVTVHDIKPDHAKIEVRRMEPSFNQLTMM